MLKVVAYIPVRLGLVMMLEAHTYSVCPSPLPGNITGLRILPIHVLDKAQSRACNPATMLENPLLMMGQDRSPPASQDPQMRMSGGNRE